MIIKVTKAEKESWYNESIGKEFQAWKSPTYPGVYMVHPILFVLGEHCEVVNGKEEQEADELSDFN